MLISFSHERKCKETLTREQAISPEQISSVKAALSFIWKRLLMIRLIQSPKRRMNRFFDLPPSDWDTVAKAMNQAGVKDHLTSADINLALSIPGRISVKGHVLYETVALLRGMETGIFTREQVRNFSELDPTARSGFFCIAEIRCFKP